MPGFAYVGCRTSRERNARGDGISVYRIGADGAWTRVRLVGDLVNPSYLAFDRLRRFLYTVHGDGTEASAFRIDPASGQLTFLNRVSTGGRNPVHLMPDPTNRFMVIANHIVAGSLAEFGDDEIAVPEQGPSLQRQLHRMQAGFVPIEHDELARAEAGDLTAKFRTDGSAGSRDQYPLPSQVQGDRGNVNPDLPPTE